MYETVDGDWFEPASNYLLFDCDTEINGYQWDGNIDMSADFQNNATIFGCDATSCHGPTPNSPEFRLPDSGLPVILKNFFGSD